MNRPTHFTVPETFTIEHEGTRITGRVLERSVRRLAVQLIEPYGLLHTVSRVHPMLGGALGYEGTVGDTFKVEALIHLYQQALLMADAIPKLERTARLTKYLREEIVGQLKPVIGSYVPFNDHSFLLATHALALRPQILPPIPTDGVLPKLLDRPDAQVLLYRELYS